MQAEATDKTFPQSEAATSSRLRQRGPSCVRDLAPWRGARVTSHLTYPIRGAFHEENNMTTTIFWAMELLAMSCAIDSVSMRQHFAKVSQNRGGGSG